MKKFLVALCALTASASLAMSACGGSVYKSQIARNLVFNVNADVVLTADFSDGETQERSAQFARAVKGYLASLEQSLSTTVATSSVAAFNAAQAGEKVQVDELTYRVLQQAKAVYELTDGYYNPAVYTSVDLYGFTPAENRVGQPYDRTAVNNPDGTSYLPLPAQEYIDAFAALAAHFADVTLSVENGAYYCTKPADAFVEADGVRYEMKIDLGGIGKGVAADAVNEMFDRYGFAYGYFNFGSSSMAIKKSYETSDRSWELRFDDPRATGGQYARMNVQSVCLSTSGDYENYYVADGVRYCHIIDPFTGSPVQTGVAAVTVLGGSAAEDDALTTALMAMGRERAIEFINRKLGDRKVVMLCFNGDVGEVITNCLGDITLLNTNYRIANTVENGKIVYKDVA